MPRGQYDRKAAAAKRAEKAAKPKQRRRRRVNVRKAAPTSSYIEDRVARLEAQMNALKSAL